MFGLCIHAENVEVGYKGRPGTVPTRVIVAERLGFHLLLTILLGAELLKVVANADFSVVQVDIVQPRLGSAKIRWFNRAPSQPAGVA